jgi:hypothetical protein
LPGRSSRRRRAWEEGASAAARSTICTLGLLASFLIELYQRLLHLITFSKMVYKSERKYLARFALLSAAQLRSQRPPRIGPNEMDPQSPPDRRRSIGHAFTSPKSPRDDTNHPYSIVTSSSGVLHRASSKSVTPQQPSPMHHHKSSRWVHQIKSLRTELEPHRRPWKLTQLDLAACGGLSS